MRCSDVSAHAPRQLAKLPHLTLQGADAQRNLAPQGHGTGNRFGGTFGGGGGGGGVSLMHRGLLIGKGNAGATVAQGARRPGP